MDTHCIACDVFQMLNLLPTLCCLHWVQKKPGRDELRYKLIILKEVKIRACASGALPDMGRRPCGVGMGAAGNNMEESVIVKGISPFAAAPGWTLYSILPHQSLHGAWVCGNHCKRGGPTMLKSIPLACSHVLVALSAIQAFVLQMG